MPIVSVNFEAKRNFCAAQWAPRANAEVAKVAVPPLSAPLPSVVVPSLNVTVPVGVPVVNDFTKAVNVTDWLKADGFTEETTVVEVAALFTICDNAGEVLPVMWLANC